MRKHKTYTFDSESFGWRPELRISVNGRKPTDAERYLSEATYNRFVRLANSGAYVVEILDHDYGVAWQLRRKEAA
jgi:hypothetical protein